ncbi:MAG TPA: hypothetical protein VEW69_05750, partial [Alphaproteobacteria bacterium]|nr:hypothetical protein [Alphaproteobacteria bacterium]
EWSEARRSQGVFEFKLNRLTLARNAPGIEPAGVELRTSFTHGTDDFEWNPPPDVVERNHVYEGTLATRMCINCHQNPGVQSFTSYSRAQFPIPEQYSKVPPVLIESTPAREAELAARWRPQHPELNTYLLNRER